MSCVALLALAVAGTAQAQGRTLDDARRLIVMINSESEGQVRFGAGVIAGGKGKLAFILTANHVVRDPSGKAYESLKVGLWAPWSSAEREVVGDEEGKVRIRLLDFDAERDVAALLVELPESLGNYLKQVPMDSLAGKRTIAEKQAVHLLGQAAAVSWNYSTTQNTVTRLHANGVIQVETHDGVTTGYSGGGVFNTDWELLGLIQADAPPELQVLAIDRALGWAVAKGYAVSLKEHVAIHDFTAEPELVVPGASTRLSWRAASGGTCKVTPGNVAVGPIGSRVEQPAESTRFTLTCEGDGASVSKSASVQVAKLPKIHSFTFQEQADGYVDLEWDAEHAEACTLDTQVVQSKEQRRLQLFTNHSFTLNCRNGTLMDSRTLVVSLRNPSVTVRSFTATPEEVAEGERVVLKWNALNAEECRLFGGGMDRGVNQSVSFVVRPSRTTTYQLKCSGTRGPDSKSVTVKVR